MTHQPPIRWGLLGTGKILQRVLPGIAPSPDLSVVAVGSRTAERAAAFASAAGVERAYGSYDELLKDPGVDAVYISLPNSLHHEWTLAALRAGKHVLCEKPYSRNPIEVTEAFNVADAAGLVLQEGFMWRHTPQVRMMLDLVPSLGPIRTVRAAFSHRMRAAYNVRTDQGLAGGALMDVGCYCVSAARLLLGEPTRVYAEQVIGPDGVDVRFAGLLRFRDDLLASFDCGFDGVSESLEIVGGDAALYLPDPWHSRTGRLVLDGAELQAEVANPYRLEFEDMVAAIRGERTALLGRSDALGQARTIDALYRAAETGTVIELEGA